MTTIARLDEHFRDELARYPRRRLDAAEAEIRVALKQAGRPRLPRSLARYYGTLALTHGERTTKLHVHFAREAWAAAQEAVVPDEEVVLFDRLAPETQREYEQRAEAVRRAAAGLTPRAELFVYVCRIVMTLVAGAAVIPWFTTASELARAVSFVAFVLVFVNAYLLREHRARSAVMGCIVAPLLTVGALVVR